jgi:lipid II:glycine glycyltransferase (peptidoglycan interpeptide bridge formation enzyme)
LNDPVLDLFFEPVAFAFDVDGDRMMKHSVEDARARGLTRLKTGGVSEEAVNENHPQHGLYEFQKGFSGDAYLRYSVSMKIVET